MSNAQDKCCIAKSITHAGASPCGPHPAGKAAADSCDGVVTLAELNAGALVAADVETRAARMATVQALADVAVLPVDESAALVWARMRVHLAGAGRRVNVNDLWIAAIAVSRDLTVFTRDDDFDAIEGVAGLAVVKV